MYNQTDPMELLRPEPIIIPENPVDLTVKSNIKKNNPFSKKKCFCCKKKFIILLDCVCGKKFCVKDINKEKHNCLEVPETIEMGEKIEFKKVDKI